ncbi:hypothetical protein AB3329_01760 [Streptococcus sp. H31]|uniref:hypothetical protein n=1 Tax=Streptococcus huangxiaojuni TaxID=3237239 RepID=UPI0034A124B0
MIPKFRFWDTKNEKWLGDLFYKPFISPRGSGGALLISSYYDFETPLEWVYEVLK